MASVSDISDFIQRELSKRNHSSVSAVEAAKWLHRAGLLQDSITRPGKPLRDLLRARKIAGQRQEPNARWYVDRVDGRIRRARVAEREPRPRVRSPVSRFDEARRKYRPKQIKCVLVAESPPTVESGRFFYFEEVSRGDSLFWETMKALYPKDCPQSGYPRHRKREFLERFRDDGFYLLDAVDSPLGKASRMIKCQRIRQSLPRLQRDLREVCAADTKVILISSPVYEVCADNLRAQGVNVINDEMIDFPGSGCQRKFRDKFSRLLSKHEIR